MEQKLSYLREYDKNINLLTSDEIDKIHKDTIFSTWQEIFKEKDVKKRINLLLSIWEKYLGTELCNTISYLKDHLKDIEIMEVDNLYSILYTIKNSKGEYLYYEGRNPKEEFENEELQKLWEKIPKSIQSFYENMHNGFYYYASESMGLVPFESVTYLGDEDLERNHKINLESSFGFFTNGMGSYVAIDCLNCDNGNATFWSTKIQPKYNIDFWSYVDEWIVIGFES
ncbi:SMI1/KNR4 family protein [Clostridium estertheticum]|uniref:SMI1/KNR4 family protein n=1 Tax=Clostridium estertheticum TaxID=238834 RepID=UPI001C0CF742|nr:SMI1/KNR4 family protein [Clostridium estertheticum]MBU3202520.1 SMI1/KNR4 family protein [Clostridium estertheticum]WAG63756.1 SMI1/KNR4 family protein [Clostridium estertheticum]